MATKAPTIPPGQDLPPGVGEKVGREVPSPFASDVKPVAKTEVSSPFPKPEPFPQPGVKLPEAVAAAKAAMNLGPFPTSVQPPMTKPLDLARLPTPAAGVPLPPEAVMAQWKAEAIKRGELQPLQHMATCPAYGHDERQCQCPANLKKEWKTLDVDRPNAQWANETARAFLEVKHQLETTEAPSPAQAAGVVRAQRAADQAKLWAELEMCKVDNGLTTRVKKWHPIEKKEIELPEVLPSLWLCRKCGYAARGLRVSSHHCEPEALAWSEKEPPLCEVVPRKVKESGEYRLTLWRDADMQYHLGEILMIEGRVIAQRESALESDLDVALVQVTDGLMKAYVG